MKTVNLTTILYDSLGCRSPQRNTYTTHRHGKHADKQPCPLYSWCSLFLSQYGFRGATDLMI